MCVYKQYYIFINMKLFLQRVSILDFQSDLVSVSTESNLHSYLYHVDITEIIDSTQVSAFMRRGLANQCKTNTSQHHTTMCKIRAH